MHSSIILQTLLFEHAVQQGARRGMSSPTELAAWDHNLQAEFLAWLLDAPSTKEDAHSSLRPC